MATRRPKLPRADALGSQPSGSRPSSGSRPPGGPGEGGRSQGAAGKGSDGAEVIKAEFGGGRATSKTSTPVGGKAAATSKTSAGGKNAAGRKPAGISYKVADTKSPDKGQTSGKPGTSKDDRDLDPVPAKAFSGRMLALAVVMIAITILLAPTVKIFLEKRAEISALEAEIAGRKAEQTELNKQLSRWQDPNYVKQQARDRINMVMPGETGYWVFGGEEAAGTPGGRTGSGSSANPENLPWVDALWESIRRSATD
ncbi:septation ring formation regulator EzrA [Arthrobacter sp. MYb23]|uniref:FtsB family cell division protein n=1 Tax=unclassified Arthrobacter TaxID=235627 RepID=UPI000CFDAEAA|nr:MULTISPECIES: septum formation initiator family protein [unclassified Arthrobacter]PRB34870.1 septation ring formation regulator EzrA [Arthrobacter sp. MYb51]PRB89120.1 septation ring formation regulator EzrA [Arthrobacter sp. MYb23]